MKTGELLLGYYKQGDDMAHCLAQTDGDVVKALDMRADGLERVIKHLRSVASEIASTGRVGEFQMDADTHMINISGPDDLITKMVEKELLEKPPFEDEEEEIEDEDLEDEELDLDYDPEKGFQEQELEDEELDE